VSRRLAIVVAVALAIAAGAFGYLAGKDGAPDDAEARLAHNLAYVRAMPVAERSAYRTARRSGFKLGLARGARSGAKLGARRGGSAGDRAAEAEERRLAEEQEAIEAAEREAAEPDASPVTIRRIRTIRCCSLKTRWFGPSATNRRSLSKIGRPVPKTSSASLRWASRSRPRNQTHAAIVERAIIVGSNGRPATSSSTVSMLIGGIPRASASGATKIASRSPGG
jgi:hypothetical protein